LVVATVVVAPFTVKSPVTVRLSLTVVSDVPAPIDTVDNPDKSTDNADPPPPLRPSPATDVFKLDSSITLLATVAAPPAAIVTSPLILAKTELETIPKVIDSSVPLFE